MAPATPQDTVTTKADIAEPGGMPGADTSVCSPLVLCVAVWGLGIHRREACGPFFAALGMLRRARCGTLGRPWPSLICGLALAGRGQPRPCSGHVLDCSRDGTAGPMRCATPSHTTATTGMTRARQRDHVCARAVQVAPPGDSAVRGANALVVAVHRHLPFGAGPA